MSESRGFGVLAETVANAADLSSYVDKIALFARAYLEAAYFADGEQELRVDEDGNEIAPWDGTEKWSLEAIQEAADIAVEFLYGVGNGEKLIENYLSHEDEFTGDATRAWRYIRAGAALWFTRNGHGVGFWDGDWAVTVQGAKDNSIGEALTRLANKFGSRSLYLDENREIHFDLG